MNTKLVNAAAGVVHAAMQARQTAAGIAAALESVCLLQSPDSAAELTRRRNEDMALRGEFAPMDEPRRVPFELGGSLVPAVQWLLARVAELDAVELGDVDGRVSASCADPGHPTWLRKPDDTRGCPWCRVAELVTERHSTNEALSDAAEQLRVQRDRIAEPEVAARQWGDQWRDRCNHISRQGLRWKAEADGRKVYGEKLRAQVAELEASAEKVAGFCAKRAEYVTNLRDCNGNDADYYRWTGHAEARRQLSQMLGLPVAWPAKDKAEPAPQRQAEEPTEPGPWGDPIAYGPTGVRCGCGKDAHSNLTPCRPDSPEDPHDSPLHTNYAVPHDLPEVTS
ncbi:hypothetical protein ACFXGT_08325 [Streptomyces sp. NPDC059352]|uniref:hypothetical protein n=1 Tax=Streptomyces sp. NPDC059352 TaxID=3346810 RepID=UPI0036C10473